jgi:D-lactate dehydrogenase (cytochrome)
VRLETLQRHLAGHGLFFPPVPTYQQAMLGGTLSTNAGGAASFKYGVTRQWVRALRVLLFNGDLLEIERGRQLARPGESFEIELSDGRRLEVPAPVHRLPRLKKISAGYHAADPLDLVDLFVGAEGTLGLISGMTLDLAPLPAAVLGAVAFVGSAAVALRLARELREGALAVRSGADPSAPDVRSIELLDRNCLELVGETAARELRIPVPAGAGAALLFEVELADRSDEEELQRQAELALGGEGGETPLARLVGMLAHHDAIDGLQIAFPADEPRRRALAGLREAVPTRVLEILAERRRGDPAVKKVGGDLIVPFERLDEMMALYRSEFERRGLEYAIWGHLSDGNLHPNALARDADEVAAGYDAQLEFARHAARLGGCPLSEHGVGRNPMKQRMMRAFLGDEALTGMRRTRAALDPEARFGRGVLFPAPEPNR